MILGIRNVSNKHTVVRTILGIFLKLIQSCYAIWSQAHAWHINITSFSYSCVYIVSKIIKIHIHIQVFIISNCLNASSSQFYHEQSILS